MRYKWYSEKVRPLTNRPWTLSERALIWRLKSENPSITALEIADHFSDLKNEESNHVRNLIHNQIRLMNKAFNDKCFQCGEKLTNEDKQTHKPGRMLFLCKACQKKTVAYKRELRETALKHGYCGVCQDPDHPVVKGKTACISCLSATHRRRYNQNLCGKCGRNPIAKNSISLCSTCLGVNKQTSQLYRIQHTV